MKRVHLRWTSPAGCSQNIQKDLIFSKETETKERTCDKKSQHIKTIERIKTLNTEHHEQQTFKHEKTTSNQQVTNPTELKHRKSQKSGEKSNRKWQTSKKKIIQSVEDLRRVKREEMDPTLASTQARVSLKREEGEEIEEWLGIGVVIVVDGIPWGGGKDSPQLLKGACYSLFGHRPPK